MLMFSQLNQFCTKSQSVKVFIRQIYRFLGVYTAQHYNVKINVGLLSLFWLFGGCTFALLIHSLGSVYI